MIDAEINGKLPEVHNLEDALTSCYFGLIKYCSISVLNNFFINTLKNVVGQQICLNPIPTDWNFKIVFWPRLDDRSEPDLLIAITDPSSEVKYLFMVEVKYFSQQNVYETSEDFESHLYENQLSREYINLHQINKIDNLIVDGNAERFLIYLTADYSLPIEDFEKTLNELKTHDDMSNIRKHLLWVSWYDLYNNLLTEHSSSVLQLFEVHILNDLKNYLKKKRFWSFRGFGPFDLKLKENNFRFYQSDEQISFNWNFQENALLKLFYNGG